MSEKATDSDLALYELGFTVCKEMHDGCDCVTVAPLVARIRAAEAELAATTSAWAAAADERDQRNSELAAIRAYLGVPEDGDSIVEWLKAHAAVIRESPPEPVLRIAKHALACDARRYVGSACTCGATSKPIDGGTK